MLGTGGIAAIVLAGIAMRQAAVIDVALTVALLAAFAGLAFVRAAGTPDRDE
ncbi:MAG: monovalent cation/H+ antiporter complex subunit F [Polymorphobacter sp.]